MCQFWNLNLGIGITNLGKQRIGIMRTTKEQDIHPIGLLKTPKCHGPLRKLSPTKKVLIRIGVVKATYCERAARAAISIAEKVKGKIGHNPPAMEKMAPIVTLPPNMRQQRRIPMIVLIITALTGVLVVGFTFLIHDDIGKQSSLAYAKVTREAATIQPWPMLKPHMMVRERMASAVFRGITWMRY